MARDEGRILRRCVESLSVCDAVLVVDTGSTDDTIAVADELGCVVRQHEWRDFGHNRSLSFQEAQMVGEGLEARGGKVKKLGFEWALAIDADMTLVCDPERLRAFLAASTDAGHTMLQVAGGLEYRNVRLLRLSEDWKCKGPTHEYWTCRHGTVGEVPREIAHIVDLGDGGCKKDKFERDARLLEEGLREEPENERYYFYMANTLACQGKIPEAREFYRQRVGAGGWVEEVWYSLYQLAKLAPDLVEAEAFVQRALEVTDRTEALLWLVERLRLKGHFWKAWHYLRTAAAMAPPGEGRLFLEANAPERLAFEQSVVQYYVSPDRDEGMRYCLRALEGPFDATVRANLRFYARTLQGEKVRLRFPAPEGFWSSSVAATDKGVLNVRCVDYFIEPNGSYRRFQGHVRTRNFRSTYLPFSRSFVYFDEVVAGPPTHDSWCHGLEDIRLGNDLRFTATTLQWRYEGQPEANRMAVGRYDCRLEFEVVRPPEETGCEKNWLPLPNGNLLYRWHPLEVGTVERGALVVRSSHSTPAWWRHLRGSAPPFEAGGKTLALAHLVSDSAPRNYYSVLVELEPASWRPKAASLPFVFFGDIEYCLSAQRFGDEVHFFVSHWDRESYVVVVPVDKLPPLLSL